MSITSIISRPNRKINPICDVAIPYTNVTVALAIHASITNKILGTVRLVNNEKYMPNIYIAKLAKYINDQSFNDIATPLYK